MALVQQDTHSNPARRHDYTHTYIGGTVWGIHSGMTHCFCVSMRTVGASVSDGAIDVALRMRAVKKPATFGSAMPFAVSSQDKTRQ
jgi:hypothetical protein